MSANVAQSQGPALSEESAVTRFLRATEIDTRMLGMIAALLVIWVGFDIYSGILRPGDGLFGGLSDAAQPLDPAGADLLHRGDDHRHGAGHRHAPDRSLGRLDSGLRRCRHRHGAGLLDAGPGLSGWPSVIWIVTLLLGIAVGAAIGAFRAS